MPRTLPFVLALILAAPAAADHDLTVLKKAGVAPTTAGLRALFERHTPPTPDAARRARIAKLIADLGARDYRTRVRATDALADMPHPPRRALDEAARSDDIEVRYRARAILDHLETRPPPPELLAALRLLARKPVPGLVSPLLELLPGLHDYQRDAHARALVAVATEDDRPALQALLADARRAPRERALAARALARLGGAAWRDRAASLLSDPTEAVRLSAARALAELGDRRALAALVALLDSEDGRVRARSVATLRLLTGRNHGYSAYGDVPDRTKGAQAWGAWLVANPGAALVHPLPRRPPPRGRTLIAIYPNTLVEVDAAKKVHFQVKTYRYIWGCWGTPEGHRLACDCSTGEVTEYDASGKQIWRKKIAPKNLQDVQRLDNGNTLVAAGASALELDRTGKVVWKHVGVGSDVTSAQRMPDGRTVLCYRRSKKVVTIDAGGKVLHTLDNLDAPYFARRLPGGNTLVLSWSKNTVWEYNAAGKVVWKYSALSNPATCQRLPNGNTMISDNKGVHEITPAGKTVWTYPCKRARFHRY